MPHVRLEYTRDADGQMQQLCDVLLQKLSAHDAIPNPSSIKIRALGVNHIAIGTKEQSFVHAQLALLPGRSDAVKADLAQLILATLRTHLPTIANLSVDVDDLSPSYTKDVL